MSGNNTLSIFLNKEPVATLAEQDNNLIWQYTKAWQANGYAISPYLPLKKPCEPIHVLRFLQNLLPEGEGLDEISQLFQISKRNIFGFMHLLGEDLPGALVIKNNSKCLTKKVIRPLITEELTERLNKRNYYGLVVWDRKPRLSVAGIQDKINIYINKKNEMGFAEGELCSTHILKFEKLATAHLVINEFITMQLAKTCGLNVANVSLTSFGKHRALLVERFDRKVINDSQVKRKHMIDGCQALNLPPEYKYERNFGNSRDVAHIRNGASLPKLFEFTNHCKNPAKTKCTIVQWVLFNILIYNFDAHGKNISFFINKAGIELTPFYDLVNIATYPNFEQEFAMALGDEFTSHGISAYHLADFAECCNIPKKLVETELKRIATTILANLPPHQLPTFTKQEQNFIIDYNKLISKRCKHLLSEAKSIHKIIP